MGITTTTRKIEKVSSYSSHHSLLLFEFISHTVCNDFSKGLSKAGHDVINTRK